MSGANTSATSGSPGAEELNERVPKPTDRGIMMVPLVPIDTQIEGRNWYRHREHLDGQVRRVGFREHARDNGYEVGIRNEHGKHVKARYAKRDLALDLMPCQQLVDIGVGHAR